MKNNKKEKYSFIYFIFILVFTFSGVFYLIYQHNLLISYENQVLSLEELIEDSLEEQKELTSQIEYKNSAEYIEKLAREQLGMVKSDEIVFINENE